MATYDNNDEANTKRLVQSHGLWGVFGTGVAVCDGFSSALQYLLQHEGILAYRITGEAVAGQTRGPHSWVLAKIDGEYYHIDPTWGTMTLERSIANRNPENADFDYLCLCDEDIRATHFPDEPIPIPACTSTRSNYYKQEGFLLQFQDDKSLIDVMTRQLKSGSEWISVRAATTRVFEWLADMCKEGDQFCKLLAKAYQSLGETGPLGLQYAYTLNEQLKTAHFRMC